MKDQYGNMDNTLKRLLVFTMASGSVVLIEPAPFEIFVLFTIIYAFFCHYYQFDRIHFMPIFLISLFVLMNLIAMLFSRNINSGVSFFLITLYLIITWIGISGICMYYKSALLPVIFKGYTIGAVMTVLAGLMAFQFGLFSDTLLKYGRIQGLFKDPNVFGPYLIPANLYTLWLYTQYGFKRFRGWVFFCFFLILTFGILLSFSRAAWGQYLLAILFYFSFIRNSIWKRMNIIGVLMVIGIPVLIYIVIATDSYNLLLERTGIQNYDDNRFSNQANALQEILQHPLGAGPGQAESQLAFSTHSLYVRILFENGILGFFAFMGFYLISLGRSIYLQITSDNAAQSYFVIISASLVGILFNSFFVDTLHWRHMWLLLALPFMKRG